MAQKFLNGIEVLSTAVVDGSGLANGSSVLDVQGTQGQLFSVTDDLSGEIFAVSDISGVPIMTVNSSGVSYFDGKVGIGTQNPTTKLSLSDTTGISGTGNDTYGQIDLVNTETGTSGDQIGPFITFRGKRGAVDTTIAAYGAIGAVNTGSTGNSTGALTFLVKNAVGSAEDLVEQMRIETGGNVGIGETSPDRKLVLNGELGTASLEIKKNNDRIVYLGTGSSAATADDSILHLMDQNVIKINLNTVGDSYLNGGNVGIGITAPVAKLDVLGTSGGPVVFDYVYTTNAGLRIHGDESAMDIVGTDSGNHASTILLRNGNEGFGLLNNPNLNTLQFRSFTATADAFSIHNTGSNLSSLVDIVTLEKDGNVGIGTDDPATILHLADDNAVLRIEATTNGQNCSTWYRANGNNQWETGCNIGAGTDYQIYDRINGASRMVVGHNGDVTIPGNVGIGTTSPGTKLDVAGAGSFSDGIVVGSVSTPNQGGISLDSGDLQLGPAVSIILDDTPTASTASGSGTVVNWSVSDATTAGLLYTVKTNGLWTPVDADNEATSIGMLAIALGSNATAGMLLQGFFFKQSHGFTIGLPLYISNTAGAFTTTRPTGTNDYVRIIGYATSTNYIYFDPDKTWVKIA